MPSADITFLIVMAGLLAIFWELARPRFVFPGIAGAGALAAGIYFVWERSPQLPGLIGLSAAAALFSLELWRDTYFVSGALGTAALAYGFCRLFMQPGGIDFWLAIPLSVILGLAAVWLGGRARQARSKKLVDV